MNESLLETSDLVVGDLDERVAVKAADWFNGQSWRQLLMGWPRVGATAFACCELLFGRSVSSISHFIKQVQFYY